MKEVKVTTKYTESLLKEYLKFHYKKFNLLMIVASLILVVCGALLCYVSGWVSGIVTALLGVFFAFYPMIIIKIALSTNKRLLNAEDEYTFDENSVSVISTILGEEVANQSVNYSMLEKIEQDDNNIYIYTSKVSAMVIEKKNLKQEEIAYICEKVAQKLATRK